jgi:hypothetical protein
MRDVELLDVAIEGIGNIALLSPDAKRIGLDLQGRRIARLLEREHDPRQAEVPPGHHDGEDRGHDRGAPRAVLTQSIPELMFSGLRELLEAQQRQIAERLQALDEAAAALARLRRVFGGQDGDVTLPDRSSPVRDALPSQQPASIPEWRAREARSASH